jgi:sulfoxide reductase catalytic subunit YedY
MLITTTDHIPYSEVTPKSVYVNRRMFLAGAAVGAAVIATKPMMRWLEAQTVAASTKFDNLVKSSYSTAEAQTPSRIVTTYNNYWEFGDQKGDPSKNALKFRTSPWSISVEGEVAKPRTFTIDEILQLAPLEERIYRHRCVEGWSIIVPWIGYSLNVLAKLAQPTSKALYVTFESYYDPKQMPLARRSGLDFPYVEGLRLDEAMHPLTLLCVGMYDDMLPNQDGAPVRMVIPWKYGYKSIKSLVKVRFVSDQPPTTWNMANPEEYGFYSNVNPQVPNPRYSQATEQRLGGSFFGKRISTQMFNGYEQVANLYAGMDLHRYY